MKIIRQKAFGFNPYAPRARIEAVESCPFVAEDYDVINRRDIKVDENAIRKLFDNPVKYISPKIFEYERDYMDGQRLMEKDYESIKCVKIEVNGPRDIEFYVKPTIDSKLYKAYGPYFQWQLVSELSSTRPNAEVIDGW